MTVWPQSSQARDMAAKLRRAAGFDGGHRFQLAEAQMPGVGLAPGSARGCGRYPQPQARDAAWPEALKPWARPSSRSG